MCRSSEVTVIASEYINQTPPQRLDAFNAIPITISGSRKAIISHRQLQGSLRLQQMGVLVAQILGHSHPKFIMPYFSPPSFGNVLCIVPEHINNDAGIEWQYILKQEDIAWDNHNHVRVLPSLEGLVQALLARTGDQPTLITDSCQTKSN